jgi:hypothetical protein
MSWSVNAIRKLKQLTDLRLDRYSGHRLDESSELHPLLGLKTTTSHVPASTLASKIFSY